MKVNKYFEDGGCVGLDEFICFCGHDFIENSEWDTLTIDRNEKMTCPECGKQYGVKWVVEVREIEDDKI